jgi:GAF domain-containing protein
MSNQFLNYFRDPADNDPSFIRLTLNILLFAIIASVASIAVLVTKTKVIEASTVALGFLVLVELIALIFFSRGSLFLAKLVIPLALTIVITVVALNGNSIHDISIIVYPLIVILGNLLQGRRSIFLTTPLVAAAFILLGVLDMDGKTKSPFASLTSIDNILNGVVILVAGAVFLNLLTERLRVVIARAEANEQKQIKANKEFKALQESLEQRVAERTTDLNTANQRNEKRARQFKAVAQVAHVTTNNENLDDLLPRLASVISGQFGFYHTGIFLLDETRANAVLRASNSEGGKRMLSRKHRLQVGQAGIVGFVSATGTPRIALDVGSDAVFFDNPDLPDTRSEMALPLRIKDEVIGVLDVQSIEPNAFQQDDIEILSTLADQVSIAIQNSRSFEETQQLLQEAQKVSSSYLQDAWQVLQSEETHVGYRVSEGELQVFTKPLSSVHVKKAIESKQTVTESGKSATLTVPIRLRNEVIGVMDIHTPTEHEWDTDEVDIAEAVAERLSLALETSLLLKSTQRRAELERVTAEISDKIGSTTQFDAILRTAAEELSRVLGGSDVLVQIQQVNETSANPEN